MCVRALLTSRLKPRRNPEKYQKDPQRLEVTQGDTSSKGPIRKQETASSESITKLSNAQECNVRARSARTSGQSHKDPKLQEATQRATQVAEDHSKRKGSNE